MALAFLVARGFPAVIWLHIYDRILATATDRNLHKSVSTLKRTLQSYRNSVKIIPRCQHECIPLLCLVAGHLLLTACRISEWYERRPITSESKLFGDAPDLPEEDDFPHKVVSYSPTASGARNVNLNRTRCASFRVFFRLRSTDFFEPSMRSAIDLSSRLDSGSL